VDFCFNLGAGRLSSSTLLKALNAGRYDDAVEQLLRWDHAGNRQCAALKARREAEAELWRGQPLMQQVAA
jgi:lysozyme